VSLIYWDEYNGLIPANIRRILMSPQKAPSCRFVFCAKFTSSPLFFSH